MILPRSSAEVEYKTTIKAGVKNVQGNPDFNFSGSSAESVGKKTRRLAILGRNKKRRGFNHEEREEHEG